MTSSYHLLEMKIPIYEFKSKQCFSLSFFLSFFVNGLNMDLLYMLSKQTQHIQIVWERGK